MHKARIVRAEYRQKMLNPELKNRLIDILEDWLEAIHERTANYRSPAEGYEKEISPQFCRQPDRRRYGVVQGGINRKPLILERDGGYIKYPITLVFRARPVSHLPRTCTAR